MDFQVQKLIPKTDVQKENDQLDLFAGVHSGLDDPFNVFFRISDIEKNADQIYFYAYSMGKKKVVFWGIYDADENEFLIDSSCRYKPNDLLQMLNTWKSHAYEFYFSGVKDRITPKMALNMAFDTKNVSKETKLFADFKDYFMVNLVRKGELSLESLQKTEHVEELLGYSDRIFTSDYRAIIDEVRSHAYSADLDKNFDPLFEVIYYEIDTKKDENLVREAISGEVGIGKLMKNDFAYKMYRYIMVNYFISLFIGIEEYRIAKFIIFSDKHRKEKEKFEPRIKGSFFYEWVLEMSKVFRSDDNRSFIVHYSQVFVDFMEKRLNRTDVGVIGGPVREPNLRLDSVSSFFTEFVSKSKYSKVSFVNEMEECPMKEDCLSSDDETCGLYDHGEKRSSRFDMT